MSQLRLRNNEKQSQQLVVKWLPANSSSPQIIPNTVGLDLRDKKDNRFFIRHFLKWDDAGTKKYMINTDNVFIRFLAKTTDTGAEFLKSDPILINSRREYRKTTAAVDWSLPAPASPLLSYADAYYAIEVFPGYNFDIFDKIIAFTFTNTTPLYDDGETSAIANRVDFAWSYEWR